jgi:hypothetical protein
MSYDYLKIAHSTENKIDYFVTQFIQLSDSKNYGLSDATDKLRLSRANQISHMITDTLSEITDPDELNLREKLLSLLSIYNNLIKSLQSNSVLASRG